LEEAEKTEREFFQSIFKRLGNALKKNCFIAYFLAEESPLSLKI
tara:strand:- start:442 stop:573 length:132 start_codon:yes stop_codon:yes gene_type:complete